MSKYCSIEKAMAGKTVLENEIATLIRDYMSNTGLIVTNIETKDFSEVNMTGKAEFHFTGISIRIELNDATELY